MNMVVIAGPTATGKSDTAVELALRIGGEVVSADSMMVYRGMDIGTAKLTLAERRRVPHHLLDVVEPDEPFHVARFRELALEAIAGIQARGSVPILAGGTGLYIQSLTEGIDYSRISCDPDLRARLVREAEVIGYPAILERIRESDPETADRLHPADRKRIIRVMEIMKTTGLTATEAARLTRADSGAVACHIVGLRCDRAVLCERIERRISHMLISGWTDEVLGLLADGYLLPGSTAAQAIGYRELVMWVKGMLSLKEASERINLRTRRYAKRQMTWFRKTRDLEWIDVTNVESPVAVAGEIEKRLHNSGQEV